MRIRPGQRRDVDDIAAAALVHLRNGFVATVKDAEQIRFQHRAKIFRRSFCHSLKSADARVVDENVEAAKFFNSVCNQILNLIKISDITYSASDAAYAEVLFAIEGQIRDCSINLILVARADANIDACTNQGFSN